MEAGQGGSWWLARVALAASACGFPLTQLAIRRCGRAGAALVQVVCTALFARDVTMVMTGVPSALRRGPAALLWIEAATAGLATVANLPLLVTPEALQRGSNHAPAKTEWMRRGVVASLFGLHTVRFWIYLQPGQGRRRPVDLDGLDEERERLWGP